MTSVSFATWEKCGIVIFIDTLFITPHHSGQNHFYGMFGFFQFDNVKRVFRTVKDMMGSPVKNIRTHYLVSEEIAK